MTDFFKFKGTDGSMGFENGRVYLLTIGDHYNNGVIQLTILSSVPIAMPTLSVYPYRDCESFFENWERV
jgi:hypothetical protein